MGEFVGLEMANEELAVEVVDEAVIETEGETPEVEESDDDEIVVTIGDESPPSEEGEDDDGLKGPAPEWVKELRKTSREKDKRIRELEAKIAKPAETKPAALGNKPKLDDFDYDAEQYEKALESWHERKREHDAEQARHRKAEEDQQRDWQAKQSGYAAEKAKVKIRDFEDAEAVVLETLSIDQQAILLHVLDSRTAALAVAAIGSSPKKAKELAAIKDPVMFAAALGELKKDMTVTTRKAPPPEGKVSGSGPISAAVTGSTLERLKTKAQQTGDYTEYLAAKRKHNSK